MTDRVNSLTVILDKPVRDDDVEAIKAAIAMVKHVRSVENGPVQDMDTFLAYQRATADIKKKVFEALDPEMYEAFKKAGVFG